MLHILRSPCRWGVFPPRPEFGVGATDLSKGPLVRLRQLALPLVLAVVHWLRASRMPGADWRARSVTYFMQICNIYKRKSKILKYIEYLPPTPSLFHWLPWLINNLTRRRKEILSDLMIWSSAETTHKKCESCIAIHFALVNRYMILSFGTF